jgi:hypothetical protein
MNKEETRAAIKETAEQIAALEAKHPEQEMRPWYNDHPAALEHWKLVQRRIRLKKELGKPSFTNEQRAARALRMSENHTARRISYTQSVERSASGLSLPRMPKADLSTGS